MRTLLLSCIVALFQTAWSQMEYIGRIDKHCVPSTSLSYELIYEPGSPTPHMVSFGFYRNGVKLFTSGGDPAFDPIMSKVFNFNDNTVFAFFTTKGIPQLGKSSDQGETWNKWPFIVIPTYYDISFVNEHTVVYIAPVSGGLRVSRLSRFSSRTLVDIDTALGIPGEIVVLDTLFGSKYCGEVDTLGYAVNINGKTVNIHIVWEEYTPSWLEVDKKTNEQTELRIYPNPANGILYVESAKQSRMEIYEITGRLVKEVELLPGKNTVDISDLNSGVFVSSVMIENERKVVRKIQISR